MTHVVSIDPRTGQVVETVTQETSRPQVAELAAAALTATAALDELGRGGRARLLRGMADALEDRRDDVVALADRETALGAPRLTGELTRTCYQLRLFADVLDEGSYVEATIDHAGETPMGPRPDLRRMLVPIGPVVVFGASNFPLAFSVPGGDTAAALAAGCPVVVKAHPSHPATSQLCYEILAGTIKAQGAPAATLSLVHGFEAGAALVTHSAVRAVSFTGSLAAGTALMDLIGQREQPIPFFGELSSLNPVVVTPSAAAERVTELAAGLVASFTLGAGQFCTKPGLVLLPAGAAGDRLVTDMCNRVSALDAYWMLNEGIASAYARATERLAATPGIEVAARGQDANGPGFQAVPMLLTTTAHDLPEAATEECFGPVAVIARYADESDLMDALARSPGSLTATLHRGEGETELPGRVGSLLRERAGRFVFNGYPTGVAVTWAQQHGGPWPSTNSQHTSVGTTAIRRFLRPVTWQDAPVELLPVELRDETVDLPRRVDGVLRAPERTPVGGLAP